MHVTSMTAFFTCWVVFAFVRACRGEQFGPAVGGLIVVAPLSYMVTYLPPDMNTVLGQWALAIINIAIPPLTGLIVWTRYLKRKYRIAG